MDSPSSATCRQYLRSHPNLVDALAAAGVFAAGAAAAFVAPGGRPVDSMDLIASAVAFGLMLPRRRWPLLMLAAASGGALLFTLTTGRLRMVLVVVSLVSTYRVASSTSRALAWITGAAAALTLFAAATLSSHDRPMPPDLMMFSLSGLAVAAGDLVRTQRAYRTAVEERARRAEHGREEEARRRVAEERLRIARELHDVVAHHMTVINVQAKVAIHLLHNHPDRAGQALGHVKHASGTVLGELDSLLRVLRQVDASSALTEPAPGLDRLTALLETFTTAGLKVSHQVTGVRRPVPAPVDLTAYRIIEESLTNAHKYGTVAGATLRLDYFTAALRIEIRNHFGNDPSGPATRSGHGILGMHERATGVGGSLIAEAAPDGTFRVETVLPAPVVPVPSHTTSSPYPPGEAAASDQQLPSGAAEERAHQ
ncbi:histidine kinase [Streptomyces sp. GbtcB7]|uniref:sensor histidine kinase n=1 Tax=Streptomyces sp. GbtcB7 TaxID=2824752 RepID=UPI001C305885|nr:histidine kinase [Streptomyces sp. GbtcB7]